MPKHSPAVGDTAAGYFQMRLMNISHDLSSLNSIPTPFFLFDTQLIMKELSKLKKASEEYWPDTIVAYSVKTNNLPYLASFLSKEGVYAEVVSQDEYEMVSLCGYTDDMVVCNGPVKTDEFVCYLMDRRAIINLDSHRELACAIRHAKDNPQKQFYVGLRVNVDIEKYFPSESKAGEQGSRFGFCMDNEELGNAILSIQECSNLTIGGLHLHVSTSTRRVEIYSLLARLFCEITLEYKLSDIQYFDIGGGFFGGIPNKPQWADYLCAVSEELIKGGFSSDQLKLILEPGVSLLAGSFSYYATVVDVKNTNRSRFVVTDGSRIHIDPFFHKTSYFYQHIKRQNVGTKQHPCQIVVGFTCLEYDNIMVLEDSEEVMVNDVFRFDKLGAYTLSLSPQFISFFPAVYAKTADGTVHCVREKWTAKDFLQESHL